MINMGKKKVIIAFASAVLILSPHSYIQPILALETENTSINSSELEQLEQVRNLFNLPSDEENKEHLIYQNYVEGFNIFHRISNNTYTMSIKSELFQEQVLVLNNVFNQSLEEGDFVGFKSLWAKFVPLFTSDELKAVRLNEYSNQTLQDYAKSEIQKLITESIENSVINNITQYTLEEAVAVVNWYSSQYPEDLTFVKRVMLIRVDNTIKVLQFLLEAELEKGKFYQEFAAGIKSEIKRDRAFYTKVNQDEFKKEMNEKLDSFIERVENENIAAFKKAEDAIVLAEKKGTENYIQKAQAEIKLIKDGKKKDALQLRLDLFIVENVYYLAQIAVENAEKYKTATYIAKAQTAINALPNGDRKTAIIKSFSIIQANIIIGEAEKAITNAEKYKSASYITKAQTAIGKLQDGEKKTELNNRLIQLQASALISEAEKAVISAEKNKTASNIKKAQTAINKLPNVEKKAELLKRLDAVQQALINKQIKDVENLVVKAEKNTTVNSIATAKKKVNTLQQGSEKEALLDRVLVAEQKYLIAQAETAVKKWEKKPTATNLKTATAKINALKNGVEKDALKVRLGIK